MDYSVELQAWRTLVLGVVSLHRIGQYPRQIQKAGWLSNLLFTPQPATLFKSPNAAANHSQHRLLKLPKSKAVRPSQNNSH